MNRSIRSLIASAALFAAPIALSAQITSGQWYTFGFTGTVGSSVFPCGTCEDGIDPTSVMVPSLLTYTSVNGGILTLTDAFAIGDRFELFDNGVDEGTSSPYGTMDCNNDITICLNDPDMSKLVYDFGPGAHTFGITLASTINNGGAAYFEVAEIPATNVVPEPASLTMLATGLVGLVTVRRKRTRR